MGFLSSLFGNRPDEPKRPDKDRLIRALVKKRVIQDPMAAIQGYSADIGDGLPDAVLQGLPEATIVTIIETYSAMKNLGASDAEIFARVEAHRSVIGAGDIPSSVTLEKYVQYRIEVEHADDGPILPDHVQDAVLLARTLFRC